MPVTGRAVPGVGELCGRVEPDGLADERLAKRHP